MANFGNWPQNVTVGRRVLPAVAGLTLVIGLAGVPAAMLPAGPARAATAAACPAGSTTGAFTVTDPNGVTEVGSADNYGPGTACVSNTPATGLVITRYTTTNAATIGSFPNLKVGCDISGCTPVSGLPRRLSKLSAAANADTLDQGTPGRNAGYDYAYDIWLTNGRAWSTGKAVEVMVWMNYKNTPAAGTVSATIDGVGYWLKAYPTGGAHSYEYVQLRRKTQVAGAAINLHDILTYLVNKGYAAGSDFMQNIQVGVECWTACTSGGATAFGASYLTTSMGPAPPAQSQP